MFTISQLIIWNICHISFFSFFMQMWCTKQIVNSLQYKESMSCTLQLTKISGPVTNKKRATFG